MLTLEEKGLSGYPNKFLKFDQKEHKSDEVLKWNPRGQLPTFVYDNHVAINESLAASEFIERLHGSEGTKLTPDDPVELGLMLQRKYEISNLDKKGSDLIHYKRQAGDLDSEKVKKLASDFFDELKIWEGYVSKSDYLAGNNLTLADLMFFPNLALYVRLGLDLSKHGPNLLKYHERIAARPSAKKSWPPHWSTSPPPASLF